MGVLKRFRHKQHLIVFEAIVGEYTASVAQFRRQSKVRKLTYPILYILLVAAVGLWLWALFAPTWHKRDLTTRQQVSLGIIVHPITQINLELDRKDIISRKREEAIARVRDFFIRYGSPLAPYAGLFVDQSVSCGGDYRVLVGIAGSESGLGKINYKLYNPFGYLNNVQYASYEEALPILICKVSQEHIAKCGEDLYCLGRRYAGPGDDLGLFISKVAWFMRQV